MKINNQPIIQAPHVFYVRQTAIPINRDFLVDHVGISEKSTFEAVNVPPIAGTPAFYRITARDHYGDHVYAGNMTFLAYIWKKESTFLSQYQCPTEQLCYTLGKDRHTCEKGLIGLCTWSMVSVTCIPRCAPNRRVRSSFSSIPLNPPPNKHIFSYQVYSEVEGDYNRILTALRVGGLSTIYFKVQPHLAHIQGRALITRAPIDYTYLADPIPGVPRDHFALRMVGYLRINNQQTFDIDIVTDGGIKFWLDGVLYIDKAEDSGKQSVKAIAMESGYTSIRLEYFHSSKRRNIIPYLSLYWMGQSVPYQLIPAENLCYEEMLVPNGFQTHTVYGETRAVSLGFNPWRHSKIEFKATVGIPYDLFLVAVDRFGNSIRQQDPFDWLQIESSNPYIEAML